jgi:hypothetical protein
MLTLGVLIASSREQRFVYVVSGEIGYGLSARLEALLSEYARVAITISNPPN